MAAINGTALGGGLETALVCNYRMGTNKAIVGLPEVNLGLLPGAGGTQRLPRLIGPSQALKMMIAGTPMSAKKALQQETQLVQYQKTLWKMQLPSSGENWVDKHPK